MKKLISGVVLLGVMNSTAVLAAGSDELWEMTMKLDMKGMSMPAMTNNSCIPKGSAYDPDKDKQDKNCEVTDQHVSGNTVKWKMRCTGKDAMEGSGEMTRTADTMNGTIKMSSRGRDMTQVISGKRIGTCDAAAQIKSFEDLAHKATKENNEELRGKCKKYLDTGGKVLINESGTFLNKDLPCQDMKNAMCDKVRAQSSNDYSVYDELMARNHPSGLKTKYEAGESRKKALISACGLDMAKLERSICQKANGERKYGFLAANCQAEAQKLAKQHCEAWGRDYTSDHDNEYASICAKYSKNKSSYKDNDELADEEGGSSSGNAGKSKSSAGKEEKSGTDDNPVGAVLDGAKKLKGLFNF